MTLMQYAIARKYAQLKTKRRRTEEERRLLAVLRVSVEKYRRDHA